MKTIDYIKSLSVEELAERLTVKAYTNDGWYRANGERKFVAIYIDICNKAHYDRVSCIERNIELLNEEYREEMLFKDENVTIIFENCEGFTIKASHIDFTIVDNKNNIDNVHIKISDSENTFYNFCGNKKLKFDRILNYKDITHIIIDDISYGIEWGGEDDCFNSTQTAEIDELKNLVITIAEKH